ncbi:MAG: sigma-70 family RNA polymerase sigma factor [Oscillospiraceae bacterium]|nr:sigma-70 family RNA polymerase sigma factor [Oscillospiraceae bacterium]
MDVFSVDSLSAVPDEALVSLCGSVPSAIEQLFQRYHKLISDMARSFAGNPTDCEDYVQEGFLGLLAAASSYQPEGVASFRTYASVCIRNRMRSAFKKQHPDPAGEQMTSAVSLDDPEQSLGDLLADGEDSPEQAYLEKERIAELYERIASVLSRQELEIFHLSVSGLSYEEIAKRLKISIKSVDNAIQRARRKLRSVRNLMADPKADSCAEPQ